LSSCARARQLPPQGDEGACPVLPFFSRRLLSTVFIPARINIPWQLPWDRPYKHLPPTPVCLASHTDHTRQFRPPRPMSAPRAFTHAPRHSPSRRCPRALTRAGRLGHTSRIQTMHMTHSSHSCRPSTRSHVRTARNFLSTNHEPSRPDQPARSPTLPLAPALAGARSFTQIQAPVTPGRQVLPSLRACSLRHRLRPPTYVSQIKDLPARWESGASTPPTWHRWTSSSPLPLPSCP